MRDCRYSIRCVMVRPMEPHALSSIAFSTNLQRPAPCDCYLPFPPVQYALQACAAAGLCAAQNAEIGGHAAGPSAVAPVGIEPPVLHSADLHQ